jgi:hypothetical protein
VVLEIPFTAARKRGNAQGPFDWDRGVGFARTTGQCDPGVLHDRMWYAARIGDALQLRNLAITEAKW